MMDSFQLFELDQQDLVQRLNEGSPALFPTDTLPAIAALPKFSRELWKLKQRPEAKPLILMGARADDLFESVLPSALDDAWGIAKTYWPGPLTMVLPVIGPQVDYLNPTGTSLGMRVPARETARNLLAQSGPLATTSANLSSCEPALNAEQAAEYFPGVPLLGPIPWSSGSGLASTLIFWKSPGNWQLLRRGAVIPKSLCEQ